MDLRTAKLKEVVWACYDGPWPLPDDLKEYDLTELIQILRRFSLERGIYLGELGERMRISEHPDFKKIVKKSASFASILEPADEQKDLKNWGDAVRNRIWEEIEERLRKEEQFRENVSSRLKNLLRDFDIECP